MWPGLNDTGPGVSTLPSQPSTARRSSSEDRRAIVSELVGQRVPLLEYSFPLKRRFPSGVNSGFVSFGDDRDIEYGTPISHSLLLASCTRPEVRSRRYMAGLYTFGARSGPLAKAENRTSTVGSSDRKSKSEVMGALKIR